MPPEKEARRRARVATWEARVFRRGQEVEQAEADAAFWRRIPIDERAELIGELSREIFSLAPGSVDAPSGSSRSLVRILRR